MPRARVHVSDVVFSVCNGPAQARQTQDNSLDLRGMRVDDALSLLESFLDGLYGKNMSHAFLQHGIGSGALRDAVREHLAGLSGYVVSFRAGAREEGGERVTVVTLR